MNVKNHAWWPTAEVYDITPILCVNLLDIHILLNKHIWRIDGVCCKVEKDSNTFQGIYIYSTNIGAIFLKFQISKFSVWNFETWNLVKKYYKFND